MTARRKDPIKSKFKGPKKSLKKLPSCEAIIRRKKKKTGPRLIMPGQSKGPVGTRLKKRSILK